MFLIYAFISFLPRKSSCIFFQTVHYIPEIESTIPPIMELDWYTTASKKFWHLEYWVDLTMLKHRYFFCTWPISVLNFLISTTISHYLPLLSWSRYFIPNRSWHKLDGNNHSKTYAITKHTSDFSDMNKEHAKNDVS